MMTLEAPRLRKCTAVARPSPEVPPVMRMVFPLKVPGGGSEGRENLLAYINLGSFSMVAVWSVSGCQRSEKL